MITHDKVMEKLYEMPEHFMRHYWNKNWIAARYCYDKAVIIASFMELDNDNMAALFGNRAYKNNNEQLSLGLFHEDKVSRVKLECMKMGIDTRTYISRAAEKITKR